MSNDVKHNDNVNDNDNGDENEDVLLLTRFYSPVFTRVINLRGRRPARGGQPKEE